MSTTYSSLLRSAGEGRWSLLFSMSKGLDGKIARTLTKQIAKELSIKPGSHKYRQTRFCLELILYNARRCWQAQDLKPGEVIVVKYSRRESHYGQLGRYGLGNLSYGIFMAVLDKMEAGGYVCLNSVKPGADYLSFFTPTSQLTALFESAGQEDAQICQVNRELLILKDASKNLMDYADNHETQSMRLQLRRLNTLNSRHEFSLVLPSSEIQQVFTRSSGMEQCHVSSVQTTTSGLLKFSTYSSTSPESLIYTSPSFSVSSSLSSSSSLHTPTSPLPLSPPPSSTGRSSAEEMSPISFSLCELSPVFAPTTLTLSIPLNDLMRATRIFNRGSWMMGGRFYSETTGIPRNLREHLRMDGEGTVELDFSAMHARILYAKEGRDLDGDPYTVDLPGSQDPQKLRKAVKAAFMVVLNAGSYPRALEALKQAVRRGELELEPGIREETLLRAIKDRHPNLAHHFHSGKGIELQYCDSRIASKVFRRCILEDIPILGLHDGFRVRARDEGVLRDAMKKAHIEEVGAEPVIDTK